MVERFLAKEEAAGSNPVSRSIGINMTIRQKFILIIQTAAIVRDIRCNKHVSEDVVRCAIELPEDLLKFEDTSKEDYYTAAIELIDFEYGILQEEDYSDWIRKYIKWKFKSR